MPRDAAIIAAREILGAPEPIQGRRNGGFGAGIDSRRPRRVGADRLFRRLRQPSEIQVVADRR